MTTAPQLTPRCWQLKMNLANCYLLETQDGLLLIDTGSPKSADKVAVAGWGIYVWRFSQCVEAYVSRPECHATVLYFGPGPVDSGPLGRAF